MEPMLRPCARLDPAVVPRELCYDGWITQWYPSTLSGMDRVRVQAGQLPVARKRFGPTIGKFTPISDNFDNYNYFQ
jgi:hypothetical protein